MTHPTETSPAILNADELLAPLAAPGHAPVDVEPDHRTIAEAIAAGSIPVFRDEQAVEQPALQPPFDPEVERAAFEALVAFITAHKDEGTTVTFAHPDDIT